MKKIRNIFIDKTKEAALLLPAFIICALAFAGIRMNSPKLSPFVAPVVKADEDKDSGNKIDNAGDKKKSTHKKNKSEGEVTSLNEKAEKDVVARQLSIQNETGQKLLVDGVYEGSAEGFGGEIKVRVTVLDGMINNIEITEHDGETPSFFESAKAVVGYIVKKQTLLVDNVSGATFSSIGIKEAVADALKKAYKDPGKMVARINKTNVDRKNKKVNRQSASKTNHIQIIRKDSGKKVQDGVYEGSAVCEMFDYTVSLKVKFKDGKVKAVYGLNISGNTDKANEEYWIKAYRQMVKRILKDDVNADTVSGATYSSNAILEAFVDACNKAYSATGNRQQVDKVKQKNNTDKKEDKEEKENVINSDEKIEKGTVKDGTYYVTTICEPDEKKEFGSYTFGAKVVFENGKLKSIYGFTASDESNKSFYTKAANGTTKQEGVISQLIKKQSAQDISAVTRATCSSKALRRLYILAYNMAIGEDKVSVDDDISYEEDKDDKKDDHKESDNPDEKEKTDDKQNDDVTDITKIDNIQDGVYQVSVIVYPDEWEDFEAYNLTAQVTFLEGRFVNISNMELSDESNIAYCEEALYGTVTEKGINEQILMKQSNDVDMVSSCTCSSKAFKQLFEEALVQATDKEKGICEEEEPCKEDEKDDQVEDNESFLDKEY